MKKRQAFNLIQESFLMNYYDTRVIDNQLSNTVIIDNELEFMNLYGHDKDIYLEGFNRNNKMYVGPKGTPHTVIHELLHNLSSSFAENKRVLNGLENKKIGCLNWINEGLTDYLSTKISKEPERHYLQGVRFFRGLDSILNEIYGQNQILFESYICNNTYFLENFINNYCTYKYKDKIINWNEFVENFVFFDNNMIDGIINNLHKNILKNTKKSIFNRNPKTIDFNKFDELNVVGLIKKAYYDLKLLNPNANEELISKGMRTMIIDNDLQYISNKRGVKELLKASMQRFSLIDVIKNNTQEFTDIPIENYINNMTR